MDAIAFVPKRRLLIAIAIALASSGATAATITVGSNDDSPLTTFCNLREAIASINNAAATANCSKAAKHKFGDNDTIVFAPQLADSVITLEQGELTITKPVTIVGSGQTIDADGKSTAIYVGYGALTASDLTVQNGYSASRGGGITMPGGALTLNHVTLAYNSGHSGGAIYAHANLPAVTTTVTVTDSHIHDNLAGFGGAIAAGGGNGSTVTVSSTLIHDNAANSGGAIGVGRGGSLAITDCVLADNTASSGGGAIYAGDVSVVITESTISGNSAHQGGALDANNVSRRAIAITNSTLASNTATSEGGAIRVQYYKYGSRPNITLTNATISGNAAPKGAAMYFAKALRAGTEPSLDVGVANSIVSANSTGSGGTEIGGYFTLIGTNNLFGTTLNVPAYNNAANNNVFTDTPGLGPLQNNGGFTDTMALLTGSPAIDAGSNDSAAALTTDQRGAGFPRVVNGTVDIGAYEFGDHIFADGFESGP